MRKEKVFYIDTPVSKQYSYVLQVLDQGDPHHLESSLSL